MPDQIGGTERYSTDLSVEIEGSNYGFNWGWFIVSGGLCFCSVRFACRPSYAPPRRWNVGSMPKQSIQNQTSTHAFLTSRNELQKPPSAVDWNKDGFGTSFLASCSWNVIKVRWFWRANLSNTLLRVLPPAINSLCNVTMNLCAISNLILSISAES